MLKRILLIISILTVLFLIFIGTTRKPFNIMITMAQQYAENYIKGGSDLEAKENNKNTEKPEQNLADKKTENEKDRSEKPEQPKKADPPENVGPQTNNQTDSPLSFENTTKIDQNGREIVTNVNSLLVLVNKKRNLPADFAPKNLVIPDVPFPFEGDSPKKYLRQDAAQALEELFQTARKENLDLLAASGYRSYETQKNIFENKARAIGEEAANRTSAYPGQSEHQTGLAMDLTSSQVQFQLVEEFGDLKEGKWLKENAHKFGFIIRYPKGKEDITGYQYEPWHLRYVGKEAAEYIYTKGITLEEYFAQLYDYK
ncbi:M15 family metallopeptidase [Candidatus Formimonas warabiya]|uniref:D-alanyl-D-alanine carboxypeptidase-like core domain-containing protein n=1 Tax=Formimonas warabiya TaxID=1761012 RepID=A0A3G1KW28_FORW1|nr:M15 family metallopeptidase [Candidatus Formimonas warabiya]ATW26597.1 hypothetical protein DCMF_19215 [Candidatus Formimonas warabiya]